MIFLDQHFQLPFEAKVYDKQHKANVRLKEDSSKDELNSMPVYSEIMMIVLLMQLLWFKRGHAILRERFFFK